MEDFCGLRRSYRLGISGCGARAALDALETGQGRRCTGLARAAGHEGLQHGAGPWRVELVLVIGPLLVLAVALLQPRSAPLALEFVDRCFRFRLPRLRFFALLGFGAHGGDGVGRARDGADGGGVVAVGEGFQALVFGVVQVLREGVRGGEEFVFDHDVDVVGGEARAHGFFGRRRGWRRGGGCTLGIG